MDGMVYAALAYQHDRRRAGSPTLDTAAAEAAPGVVAGDDAPQRAADEADAACSCPRRRRPAATTCRSCRTTAIHWNGQPIAVVLAETQEQADHAASLIARRPTTPSRRSPSFAERQGARAPSPGMFMGEPLQDRDRRCRGGAGRRAAHGRRTSIARRATTTTRSSCTPRRSRGRATSCASTTPAQLVAHTALDDRRGVRPRRGAGARHLALSSAAASAARCLWEHQILGAAAAKLAGRPVRIALSREGVYRVVGGRTLTEQRVALGARGRRHASTR